MIVSIILGIIGLGIVILVHETGHFIAARLAGIEVEAFSIGWGPKLLSWRRGKTEYRISAFPIGGYCRMKGEHVLREAWKSDAKSIPKEPGSFFSAAPWKRILVSVAGPGANLFFAVLVLSIIWLAGFDIQTFGNKIILLSDYPLAERTEQTYPADKAGLKTGDRIVSVGGKEIRHYRDLQEAVSVAAEKTMSVTVLRNGRRITTQITPEMDPQTGIGRIGVYAWIEPVIGTVQEGSPADQAGLRPGDRIVRVNGREIEHTLQFSEMVQTRPDTLNLRYERNGRQYSIELTPQYTGEEGRPSIGIAFATEEFRSPRIGPIRALGKGFAETGETIVLTIKSIGLLFKGIGVRESLVGPIRITYYVGEVASQGFKQGIASGFSGMFRFLSLLSVAIFFMNLLPIPALDGGMVILFLIEMIRGRGLKPKVVYRYQTIGITLILGLLLFATFNDVFFLAKG